MQMAKRSDVFKSKGKYLKASDLSGPVTVTIERAPLETLGNGDDAEAKTVLYFVGQQKCFPLNLTNWDAIADLTGEADSDDWPGHKIELYPTTTNMKGEVVPCVRVRSPSQGELTPQASATRRPIKKSPPSSDDDLDDEIPFN
jgi:hypothetical protein